MSNCSPLLAPDRPAPGTHHRWSCAPRTARTSPIRWLCSRLRRRSRAPARTDRRGAPTSRRRRRPTREKPPVLANTSSTSAPAAMPRTSARLSRWSRKCPVFCPCTTSASRVRPRSRNEHRAGSAPHRRPCRRRPVRTSRRRPPHGSDGARPARVRAAVDSTVDDDREVREPRRRVHLHDERPVVAIDDEARQAVVLAVHAAVRRWCPGRRRAPAAARARRRAARATSARRSSSASRRAAS